MPVELTELEKKCRAIGHVIARGIELTYGKEKQVGFCFLMFDFGECGHMTYISNAQREDMILALREFAEKLTKGEV